MPDIEKLKVKTGPTSTSFDLADKVARQQASRNSGKLTILEGETLPMMQMDIDGLRDQEQSNFDYLNDKIKDLELFKFPNATIVGSPNIENGQVRNFTEENYLIFPMIIDVRNIPFQIDMNIHTSVWPWNEQQNILDSRFGLALAIKNNHLDVALSSNGISWDIGEGIGHNYIDVGTDYFIRLIWDGDFYKVQISNDGIDYIDDIIITSQLGLHPTQIFIGSSPNIFGPSTAHPFKGSINLNKCYLRIDGKVVWSGMDDAGLATRADLSLSNIDDAGKEVIRDIARSADMWEEIYDITLEEPVIPDITVNGLKEIAVIVSAEAGDVPFNTRLELTDRSQYILGSLTITPQNRMFSIYGKCSNNMLFSNKTTIVSGINSSANLTTTPASFAAFVGNNSINKITFTGSVAFPVGTNIKIYGVRA